MLARKKVVVRQLSREEEDAMCQCLHILGPRCNAEARVAMANFITAQINKGEWFPVLRPWEAALLFYPDDPAREDALLKQICKAIEDAELVAVGQGGGILKAGFSGWRDCPLVPAASPLWHWLPPYMREPSTDPNNSGASDVGMFRPFASTSKIGGATAAPAFPMTKAALVSAHRHEWPTIERDIVDASKNGLSKARRAEGKRGWIEPVALDWARAMNKLIQAGPVPIDQLLAARPVLRHKLR